MNNKNMHLHNVTRFLADEDTYLEKGCRELCEMFSLQMLYMIMNVKKEEEMCCITTLSTYFIYGYIALDTW